MGPVLGELLPLVVGVAVSPKWMSAIDEMRPVTAMGIAFALAAINLAERLVPGIGQALRCLATPTTTGVGP
ncbi:hypothetical protein [Gordonia sp. NPDC127522]|uniref:hypothetical protein n=1 Tax=Gordonia sp. NPDC127522 TaxID=3345390 RepID=UPI00362AF349